MDRTLTSSGWWGAAGETDGVTTGRFAPSPSGPLHVGKLRVALVAWCAARHDGARFLLRVDDPTAGAALVPGQSQLAAKVRAGRTPSLRLRADDARVTAHDVRLGELTAVVDDAAQGVDQVVRGDDLWRTSPRHVLLQQLLGVPTPEYLHVPLVLSADGRRLAKRHGAIRLDDLRARGVGPEEVRDRLVVSLGLAAPGERPPLHVVVERFDPLEVPADPWVWH